MFRAIVAILGFALGAWAHDIPVDVSVQAMLKPEGHTMHLLVRVPLKAMRDVDFPQFGRGYLDLQKLDPLLADAARVWIADAVELREGEERLAKPEFVAARISLPSDRSFASFAEARAHLTGPKLGNDANVVWEQVMLDAWFAYPIRSADSAFSIRPGLERLASRVVTALRFFTPSGDVRAYELVGDPGLVRLDPRWHQAAWRFVQAGFLHILDGTDHLLFLFCLVIPLRRMLPLAAVVSAFTVAHSITLIASAYDLAPDAIWFPPLVEAAIAVSVVYMALENIVGVRAPKVRWTMAFAFGLVHGFGFSFALRESLQFAGRHLLTSLVAFNLGVELGQLLVLALLVPVLGALFRFVVAERTGTIILSALAAHTGWHWMLDRAAVLRRFGFEVPWAALACAVAFGIAALLMVVYASTAALRALRRVLYERQSRITAPVP